MMKKASLPWGLVLCAALALTACGWGHSARMLKDSRPFKQHRPLRVSVDLPVGTVRITRGDDRSLYDLQFSYCRHHFRVNSLFQEATVGQTSGEGDRLTITGVGIPASPAAGEEPNLLSLLLRAGTPTDLRVAGGIGDLEMDLTGLSVRHLTVHGGTSAMKIVFKAGNPLALEDLRVIAGTGDSRLEGLGWGNVASLQFYGGAGSASLDWSGPGPREAAAFVDAGTGSIEMVLPKDLGVAISGRGLEPVAPPEGFRAVGDAWASLNFQQVDRHLTVVLDRGNAVLRFR